MTKHYISCLVLLSLLLGCTPQPSVALQQQRLTEYPVLAASISAETLVVIDTSGLRQFDLQGKRQAEQGLPDADGSYQLSASAQQYLAYDRHNLYFWHSQQQRVSDHWQLNDTVILAQLANDQVVVATENQQLLWLQQAEVSQRQSLSSTATSIHYWPSQQAWLVTTRAGELLLFSQDGSAQLQHWQWRTGVIVASAFSNEYGLLSYADLASNPFSQSNTAWLMLHWQNHDWQPQPLPPTNVEGFSAIPLSLPQQQPQWLVAGPRRSLYVVNAETRYTLHEGAENSGLYAALADHGDELLAVTSHGYLQRWQKGDIVKRLSAQH
ncbi:hypothetical protein [Idiomarina xiamenensis]|uniref:Lipoprotein n=1 Tax=Idiomarina xiamenensis 10-D-4 TaxID=740709 RepID=K2JYK4_9GAMM|nr:hypothetical protein [Idiomarina xiamenensis]EKE80503.1 hypothetical protein A10D4_11991 [Idiomarina xiamenensis 10-D-4]